jgi:hypothetical protein
MDGLKQRYTEVKLRNKYSARKLERLLPARKALFGAGF